MKKVFYIIGAVILFFLTMRVVFILFGKEVMELAFWGTIIGLVIYGWEKDNDQMTLEKHKQRILDRIMFMDHEERVTFVEGLKKKDVVGSEEVLYFLRQKKGK